MRSGTTLLYRLLNNHPQIALMYETDIFALRPLLWSPGRDRAWIERLDFWGSVLTRHGLVGEAARGLPGKVDGPGEAFRALGRAWLRRKPGVYVGGKSIHYNHCLPEIARLFPGAHFIVLYRPLAAIIDSLQRAGRTQRFFAPARRVRHLFQQYIDLVESVVALRGLNRPVHELTYRELVDDPEAVGRQLCDFLELPYAAADMLTNDPRNLAAIPDEEHHFHARHSASGDVTARTPEISPRLAATVRAYESHWAAKYAGQPVRLAPRSDLPPGPPRRFSCSRAPGTAGAIGSTARCFSSSWSFTVTRRWRGCGGIAPASGAACAGRRWSPEAFSFARKGARGTCPPAVILSVYRDSRRAGGVRCPR